MSVISVKNLSKSYGSHPVLSDISFEYESGQIIGLLGPNGSGKTTLIKILTGLIHDYSGEVLINYKKIGVETKAQVAYLPDRSYLPEWMRPTDAIDMFADFYADFDKNKAYEMLRSFELDPKQKIKTMSKGMKEKVRLMLVMCRNASLYILDEPFGGVDPAARQFILDTIMVNRPEGSTILLSTHLIYDMEGIFDKILMIGHGKVLVDSDTSEITDTGKTVEQMFKEVFGNAWQVD